MEAAKAVPGNWLPYVWCRSFSCPCHIVVSTILISHSRVPLQSVKLNVEFSPAWICSGEQCGNIPQNRRPHFYSTPGVGMIEFLLRLSIVLKFETMKSRFQWLVVSSSRKLRTNMFSRLAVYVLFILVIGC